MREADTRIMIYLRHILALDESQRDSGLIAADEIRGENKGTGIEYLKNFCFDRTACTSSVETAHLRG